MNRFPKDIAFFHPWRRYQRDVLQHLHQNVKNYKQISRLYQDHSSIEIQ